jgi:hypothetical protein
LATSTVLPRWQVPFPAAYVRARRTGLRSLAVAALCLAAYAPALDNGFISDDYVVLEWIKQWHEDPTFLLRIAPDVFRITSYAILGLLKAAFGYRAAWFYGAAILVHFINCLLLCQLATILSRSRRIGLMAAALFAVVQNPQEAIMWLAAMGDALAAGCVIGALVLWLKDRPAAAALVYGFGLFSKESAAVFLILVPLVDFCRHGRIAPRARYLYLLPPTLVFAAVFLWNASHNYMITNGTYAFGLHGLVVWGFSLHRLLWPWGYLAAGALAVTTRPVPVRFAIPLLWMMAALTPYIFLTAQNHVPSRHTYLASMGLAAGIALAVAELRSARFARVLMAAFVGCNIAYLWLVKDRQFEVRAAPTTRLIESLSALRPGPVRIVGFPLLPGMATTAARHIPGWDPAMVLLDAPPESCPDCQLLRWEPATATYVKADERTSAAAY